MSWFVLHLYHRLSHSVKPVFRENKTIILIISIYYIIIRNSKQREPPFSFCTSKESGPKGTAQTSLAGSGQLAADSSKLLMPIKICRLLPVASCQL
jgi:hypothetical protein